MTNGEVRHTGNLLTRNPIRGRVIARGDTPASILCAPNLISIVRILLIPVFVVLLLVDGGANGPLRWAAAIIFVLAIATDAIDGHLARSRNLVTDLGIFLDPVADKGLTGAAFIGLGILGELWWWVIALVLVREIGITIMRSALLKDRVIPASKGGKLKTVAQSVALSLALLPFWSIVDSPAVANMILWVNWVAMAIAVALTVITGIDYVVKAVQAKPKPKPVDADH